MRTSHSALLSLAFTGACATTSPHGAVTAASAQAETTPTAARCAVIADSVRAATPVADLRIVAPQGQPRIPTPRRVPAGEIHTTFLVDPTGRAVRGTVVTTGNSDQEYHREMEDAVLRMKFRAPVIAGCPSWGRGDFRLRAEQGRR